MAEGIVNLVLDKLSDVVVREFLLMQGVGKQVNSLLRELSWIQAFLKDTDMEQIGNEIEKYWVEEVRDVAYDIEDVIDSAFLLKVLENPSRVLPRGCSRIVGAAKRMWSKRKNLATEMNEILAQIQKINEKIKRDGINFLDEGSGERLRLPVRPPLPDIDDPYVVGFNPDIDNIIKQLLDTSTKRRSVISIVGPGGLGKTTLARKVYNSNDVKRQFDVRIWVTISQEFNLMDILRKIIEQIEPLSRNDLEGVEQYLPTKLYKTLNGKKYLLVLDDIWTSDLWSRIGSVLPDNEIGSRVMITSRFLNIADDKPYKLPYLTEESSLELLFKKALPNRDLNKGYPDDLGEVGKIIVKKYGGLPLALVVLGGLLSKRPTNYIAWNETLQTMDWDTDGRKCIEIIATSYNDLPFVLKSCFMYFAVFPEDHEIHAQRLFRLWVAEGFIPKEESRTLEDTAESFLEDLVQRSMVEVSSRSINGSIKCCHLLGIFHDLAMHEARKQRFFTVFSQASDVNQPKQGIRRASFQYCSPQFMEYVGPNIRSLLWFGQDLPNFFNFRILKVLEVMGIKNNTLEPVRGLDELIFLKYLSFRNCEISISCSFRHFKNLETLDMRGTQTVVSDALWEIDTLRHVLCDSGLNEPISLNYLDSLQTMRWISLSRTWYGNFDLPNLCKLGVCWVYDWTEMTGLLIKLPNLVSLGIKASLNKTISLPMEIVYPKALPKYENLQSLHLQGKWSTTVTLDARLFPPNLLKLTLVDSQLEQNPMLELGKLPKLKKLCLRYRVTNYTGPITCSEGFPELQYLEVVGSNIKDLTVTQGVMPKLKYLQLQTPINFKFHLPSVLEHVTVQYFGSTLEGKDQICKQFPLASFN